MAIQDILEAWARGRAMDDPPNDIKPPGWTKSIRTPGTATVKAPILPEDDMIRVDSAISSLKNRKPTHHKVIVLAYLYRKRDPEVARLLHGSRSWAREIRVSAEHWLEAKIID
jgi:hypothetical protein